MKLDELLAELRPSEPVVRQKASSSGMDLVRIYSEDWSDHIDTIDLLDDCRDPARCGGCGYCTLAQALHYGCKVAPEYDVPMSKEMIAARHEVWKREYQCAFLDGALPGAFVDWSQP